MNQVAQELCEKEELAPVHPVSKHDDFMVLGGPAAIRRQLWRYGTEYLENLDPELETIRVSMRIPMDVFEAIGLAAHAEGMTRQELVIRLLTMGLSQMPRSIYPDEPYGSQGMNTID